MIKCIVVKRFVDKNNGNYPEIGDILSISKKRYKELKNYVRLFEETAKKSGRRKDENLDKNV